MSNDASKVAAGKPKIGGALYWAPADTTLPTDASTDLASDFKCLGYIADDGFKNDTARSVNDIYAWGGDKVLTIEEKTDDTFKYKLIECTNTEVLKHVYGSANVEVTAAVTANPNATPPVAGSPEKIHIKVKRRDVIEAGVFVAEILLQNAIKRIVVPCGKVKEVAEIDYTDTDAVGYDTTLDCQPYTSGGETVYHHEYIEVTA